MINKLISAFFLLILTSCGAEHDSSPSLKPGAEGSNSDLKSLLTSPDKIIFSDVEKFVLKPSCVECHSTNEKTVESQINFENYETTTGLIKPYKKAFTPFNAEASSMYTVLLIPSGSLHMPPFKRPQLNDDQKNLVFQWIQNGGKKVSSEVINRPPSLSEKLNPYFLNPESIDYKTVNEFIFEPKCNKCHSTKSPDHEWEATLYGQDMTDYEKIIGEPGDKTPGVIPGRTLDRWVDEVDEHGERTKIQLKGSRIYKSSVVFQTMPPPDRGYLPINGLESKLLRLWILNCAIKDFDSIKENDNLDPTAIEKKLEKRRLCNN